MFKHEKIRCAVDAGTRLGKEVLFTLREKCMYSEFFWSAFSRIQLRTKKLLIRKLFTQCYLKEKVCQIWAPSRVIELFVMDPEDF